MRNFYKYLWFPKTSVIILIDLCIGESCNIAKRQSSIIHVHTVNVHSVQWDGSVQIQCAPLR